MTVTEAATTLNISSYKLLSSIRKEYPDQNWSLESELPEEALSMVEQVCSVEQPALPASDLVTAPEAAQDFIPVEPIDLSLRSVVRDEECKVLAQIQENQLRAAVRSRLLEDHYKKQSDGVNRLINQIQTAPDINAFFKGF